MRFEATHGLCKLGSDCGIARSEVVKGECVANARNDVLALCVGEVVAIVARRSGRGITREGNSGARILAKIAEDHRTHIDGRAEVIGDTLAATIQLGTFAVPRLENGAHGHVELLAWVLWEFTPALSADNVLVESHQFAKLICAHVTFRSNPRALHRMLERFAEELGRDVHDGTAIHGDQPPIRVPSKSLISRCFYEALHRCIIEPDVQDRVHHAWHGEDRTGTHGHQQWIVGVAQLATKCVFETAKCGSDLHTKCRRLLIMSQKPPTSLSRDSKSRGHRQAQTRHLCKVGALATEEFFLVAVALREVVDKGSIRHSHSPIRRLTPRVCVRVQVPAPLSYVRGRSWRVAPLSRAQYPN